MLMSVVHLTFVYHYTCIILIIEFSHSNFYLGLFQTCKTILYVVGRAFSDPAF